MALPPKGDPQRPLHLAIRSMRLLGIVFLLFSLCGMLPALMSLAGVRGSPAVGAMIAVGVAFVYLVPGVLYLVCVIYVKQRRHWAVILGLVVVSMHVFFALIGAAGMIVNIAAAGDAPRVVLFIILGVILLFLAAFAQLIYHLSKSFEAIRLQPAGADRGFEVTMPVPPPVAQVISTNWDPSEEQKH